MILGIESSCDESAVALVRNDGQVIGEWVHSQISKHADYGGVVPDLAVAEHLENFFPLLDFARKEIPNFELIEKIAVTCGPGLVGCLGIGISIAKTLSLDTGIPVYGINHLRGHAFSPFMSLGCFNGLELSNFLPHVGLLVSGGNTLLFKINRDLIIEVIAATVDDAVGEALDKGAKLLGIPYPGGADLEKYALNGDEQAFEFPKFNGSKKDLRFSFSGLKTSLLYRLKEMSQNEIESNFSDICASYQKAAFDQLTKMTKTIISSTYCKSFGLSGGVANNQRLRNELSELCEAMNLVYLPVDSRHTGDNAAMIAFSAAFDPNGLWENKNHGLTFQPSLQIHEIENKDHLAS